MKSRYRQHAQAQAQAPSATLNYKPHDKWPGAPNAPSDKVLKENPEVVAFQFYDAVDKNKLATPELRNQLKHDLREWISAEGIIYATVIETLVDAPHFIIPTEGTGRAQLQHLLDLHQGQSKRATQTLIKIYNNFKYLSGPPPEGLSRYHQRLHELLHEIDGAS